MEEKLINTLREAMDMDGAEIKLADSFRDYENWDSLAHLSLVAALDEEFGVEIEDDDFQKLVTVQDLYNAVQERVKG